MLFNFESLNFHSLDCYFTFLQYVNKYLKPETTSLKRIVNHNITHLFLWEMRARPLLVFEDSSQMGCNGKEGG